MKIIKIFSLVLLAHLIAIPLIIMQIGVSSKNTVDLNEETSTDPEPIAVVDSAEAPATIATMQTTKMHTVRQGENPSMIAAKYGMETTDLMTLNGIKDASKLQVGDKLKVFSDRS
tara:strand:+ start:391 stop:735 length:345 start_codon:yes stop_codon:yes gene_type:complete